VHQRSEKYIAEGSKYAHWIRLYLSFHLNWVLGPFVHRRLQILQTSEVTFGYVIIPLSKCANSLSLQKEKTLITGPTKRRTCCGLAKKTT